MEDWTERIDRRPVWKWLHEMRQQNLFYARQRQRWEEVFRLRGTY